MVLTWKSYIFFGSEFGFAICVISAFLFILYVVATLFAMGGSGVVVMMAARMLLPATIINTSVHPPIIYKYTKKYTKI